MEALISALTWWLIGSLVIYHFTLKKDRFLNLQQKGEQLLQYIYEYQDILMLVDREREKLDDIKDDIVSIEEKRDKAYKEYNLINDSKQRLREKIWTLINIYFPSLADDFREYTHIELSHTPDKEKNVQTMHSRENKLSDISHKLIKIINKERVFGIWKI